MIVQSGWRNALPPNRGLFSPFVRGHFLLVLDIIFVVHVLLIPGIANLNIQVFLSFTPKFFLGKHKTSANSNTDFRAFLCHKICCNI